MDRGTKFELAVADILRAKGYSVEHNVNMTGRSGAVHQIDVLAEYQCPLHRDTVIVETKDHGSNISKDTVMKLASIQQDLSVGNAILATTSDFTIGARKTATQYKNLNLWNGSRVKELLPSDGTQTSEAVVGDTKFIRTAIKRDTVAKGASVSAKKRSSGWLFGRGRAAEALCSVREVSYPYYEVAVKMRVSRKEKTGLLSKESVTRTLQYVVAVDGRTCELVNFKGSIMSYEYAYMRRLSSEEVKVMAACGVAGKIKRQNAVVAGLSPNKVRTIMTGLEAGGLIRRVNNRPVMYKMAVPFPRGPGNITGLTERCGDDFTEDDPGYKRVESAVNSGSIEDELKRYWGECAVISTRLVWYPYYEVAYKRSDGSRSMEILDGRTGERQMHLEEEIADLQD